MAKFYKRAILPAALVALLAAGTSEAATPVSQETFIKNLASPYRAWQKGELKQAQQSAPRKADTEQETLLEMDFSGFTEGTEEELGPHLTEGYITEGNPYIDPKYMNGQEGWWGIGVYPAGGACALARPNFGGSIATPMMNLYGNLHISCRVKVREENKGSVILFFTLAAKDIWFPINPLPTQAYYVTFKAEDAEKGWIDVNVDIPCDYIFDDAFLQFNSVCYSKTGILIDDIKITRDHNFVTPVTSIWFDSFSRDGFTAHWQPGAENKSFLVNAYEETMLSEDEQKYSEDFENAGNAEKWTTTGAEVAAAKGAEGSAGLLLKGEASVELPINYAPFNELSMWLATSGVTEESEAGILIEVLTNEGWNSLGAINLAVVDPAGMNLKFSEVLKGFSGKYTGIRLSAVDFAEGESVVLDNLAWTTQGAFSRTAIMEAKAVNDEYVNFTDIDPDKRYYVQVAGVNGELVAPYTTLYQARGVAAPALLPASDIDIEGHAYTARWEAAPLADSYTVSSYAVRTLKAEKECEVFYDTFENAKADDEGRPINIDQASYDGIANHKGWECLTGDSYMDNSKIGGTVIASPEISLQNNNGKFTVSFTAYSYVGSCNIIVQSGRDIRVARLEAEYDPMVGYYKDGMKEVTMEFDNGTPHTKLLFYTSSSNSLLISNVSVTQDINEGDKFYELIEEQKVEAPATELAIKNLPATEGNMYAFNVVSHRKYDEEQTVTSDKGDNMEVSLVNSVEELEGATEIAVRTNGNAIEIRLGEAARVSIYNAAGVQVAAFDAEAGINTVADLAKGAYIVKVGEKVCKVIL